jgi:hypothetical protein
MSLGKSSVTTLIDLVEIKLEFLEIQDNEDRRSKRELVRCRNELNLMLRSTMVMPPFARGAAVAHAGAMS